MADNNTKKFIKEQEGFDSSVYDDTEGNPTIGYGANLNSPEVPAILESMGKSPERLLSGEEQLTPEEAAILKDKQLQEKSLRFRNIRKQYFPKAEILPHEETALMSMAYNSPKLLGPNMRQYLDQNQKELIAKEILLRSNKDDVPGIQKRRLEEAQQYSGENFQEYVQRMSAQEIDQIRSIIKKIKNPHERKKVLEQFPFLNDPKITRPYKKLIKD